MAQLFDSVLKAQNEKKILQPSEILPVQDDAIAFLGHASFMPSFKRPEFLKPEIAIANQSVCNKSNPANNLSLWR